MKGPGPGFPLTVRRYRLALLGLLVLSLALAAEADDRSVQGRVTWVYDGDSLKVTGVGKVRLLGIDTPEHAPSARDRFFRDRFEIPPATLRRVAEQALHFNIEHAKGRTVRLVFDRERKDRHGRTLAYVYLPDGRLLNRLLLEKGLAVVYRRFDFALKEDFLAAEAKARRQGVGLWEK